MSEPESSDCGFLCGFGYRMEAMFCFALEPSANIIVSSGRASGRAGDSASSGPERSLDARDRPL